MNRKERRREGWTGFEYSINDEGATFVRWYKSTNHHYYKGRKGRKMARLAAEKDKIEELSNRNKGK